MPTRTAAAGRQHERRRESAAVVRKRAVARTEVFDNQVVADGRNLQVQARDLLVGNDDMARRISPDGERLGPDEMASLGLVVVHHDDVAAHSLRLLEKCFRERRVRRQDRSPARWLRRGRRRAGVDVVA